MFKLTKNNTFINVFCNRTFSYYRFLPIFLKRSDLYTPWLILLGEIFSTTLLFPISKVSNKVLNIIILKCFLLEIIDWARLDSIDLNENDKETRLKTIKLIDFYC